MVPIKETEEKETQTNKFQQHRLGGGRGEGGKKNEAMKINLHHHERMQDWHRDPGTLTQTHTFFYFYFLSCKRNVEIEYELGPEVTWALILTEHFPKPINAELPF